MKYKNGKISFNTCLPTAMLTDFRNYCFSEKIKMNEVLEKLLEQYLDGVEHQSTNQN